MFLSLSLSPTGLPPSLLFLLSPSAQFWILVRLWFPPFSPLSISTLSPSLSPSCFCLPASADCWLCSPPLHLHFNSKRPRTTGRGKSDTLTLIWWRFSPRTALAVVLCNCLFASSRRPSRRDERMEGQTHKLAENANLKPLKGAVMNSERLRASGSFTMLLLKDFPLI